MEEKGIENKAAIKKCGNYLILEFNMVNYRIVVFLFLLLTSSCNVGPQPISYGSDGCHFCSMTIVDRQHAAEIVTDKGKGFKFDRIPSPMGEFLTAFKTEQAAVDALLTYEGDLLTWDQLKLRFQL